MLFAIWSSFRSKWAITRKADNLRGADLPRRAVRHQSKIMCSPEVSARCVHLVPKGLSALCHLAAQCLLEVWDETVDRMGRGCGLPERPCPIQDEHDRSAT